MLQFQNQHIEYSVADLAKAVSVIYALTAILTKADFLKPARNLVNKWYQTFLAALGYNTHFAAAGCHVCVGMWVSLPVASHYFGSHLESFLFTYGLFLITASLGAKNP